MSPKARKRTRQIVGIVAGIGAGLIVNTIISATIYPDKPHQRILVGVGKFTISGVVGEKARAYAEEFVDDAFEVYDVLRAEWAKK